MSDEDVKLRFNLVDSRYWDTCRERQKVRDIDWWNNIIPYLYRPFDKRWVLYQPNLIEIGRGGASKFLMPHMIKRNLSIVTMRQVVDITFKHIFVSDAVNDMNILTSHHVSQVTFPLYLYQFQFLGQINNPNSPQYHQLHNQTECQYNIDGKALRFCSFSSSL